MNNLSIAVIIPTIKESPFLLETVKSVAVATERSDLLECDLSRENASRRTSQLSEKICISWQLF
jgi:hypothetical protein